jgi:ADP-heptose:LPS heptosyltransferase
MRCKKILIIRLSALGDVAMTIPVIYSLAQRYHQHLFVMVTRPSFSELFINRPKNLKLFIFDSECNHKGVVGLVRLVTELHQLKPDMIADLHNVIRSWIIDLFFLMIGKRVAMVDKDRYGRLSLLRHNKLQKRNFITRYFDVFRRLHLESEANFSTLFPHGSGIITNKEIGEILSKTKSIGIAPISRFKNKNYPIELMVEVIHQLIAVGYHIFIFGSKDDGKIIMNHMQENIPQCTNLSGQMDIKGELSIISHLDVMVSMDSANMHLASLTSTPVVSLWGATTPACGFLGYGQEMNNAICLNLDCQPCSIAGSDKCALHSFKCMTEIKPSVIVEKVIQATDRSK